MKPITDFFSSTTNLAALISIGIGVWRIVAGNEEVGMGFIVSGLALIGWRRTQGKLIEATKTK